MFVRALGSSLGSPPWDLFPSLSPGSLGLWLLVGLLWSARGGPCLLDTSGPLLSLYFSLDPVGWASAGSCCGSVLTSVQLGDGFVIRSLDALAFTF